MTWPDIFEPKTEYIEFLKKEVTSLSIKKNCGLEALKFIFNMSEEDINHIKNSDISDKAVGKSYQVVRLK